MLKDILIGNIGFLVLAAALMGWARWRTRPGPLFTGPCPVGPAFKGWLINIWLVGLVLPVVTLAIDWSSPLTRLALVPYLLMFAVQVLFELVAWKRWGSPVWVIVPCLFLPWRLFQVWSGLQLGDHAGLTQITLYALFVLWVINIGVHYTNIPNTMRWNQHPADTRFPSLNDPRVFVKDAQ